MLLGALCTIEVNVMYAGNPIGEAMVTPGGADECANECGQHPECLFWTLTIDGNKCIMKTSDSGRQSKDGKISGQKACATGKFLKKYCMLFSEQLLYTF